MAKNELKAKIIYNEKEDSFDIMTDIGDGWGLCKSFKCRKCAENPTAEVANFISWTILAEIDTLQKYGYKVTLFR